MQKVFLKNKNKRRETLAILRILGQKEKERYIKQEGGETNRVSELVLCNKSYPICAAFSGKTYCCR